jgi:hypothetical protein
MRVREASCLSAKGCNALRPATKGGSDSERCALRVDRVGKGWAEPSGWMVQSEHSANG